MTDATLAPADLQRLEQLGRITDRFDHLVLELFRDEHGLEPLQVSAGMAHSLAKVLAANMVITEGGFDKLVEAMRQVFRLSRETVLRRMLETLSQSTQQDKPAKETDRV